MADKKVSFAIIGAGSRGLDSYGKYIQEHLDEAEVVAVAEPREFQRKEAVRRFNIPAENVFTDWKELLARPKLADAIIIATTDRMHTAPAIQAAEKKYHILLEKPMASTADECIQIVEAAKKNGVFFAVCHVLRYAPFYTKIKSIIDSGELGEICSIQHMEGIAWWHFAHSFVRGNFGNEARSSFILLAKSCHDVDILKWMVSKPCLAVQSFGHLKHFRKECKPAEAGPRCMDCPLADGKCPYSAKTLYFGNLRKAEHGWPLAMVIDEMTEDALEKALREGPYGRCVYQSDNDVVDTQTVNMEFEDNITVDFTMSAFTPHGRKIRIMGSKGYLEGDDQVIRMLKFHGERDEDWVSYDVNKLATDITGGHGGGDQRLMNAFITAIRTDDESLLSTGPDETLESHLMVFAAEKARLENRIVTMDEMYTGHEQLHTHK
ncbi:MAG: Gfo/Idh/MocA family oxidoreductase [Phycisphaerae bacterium]|nr:Gfo/Idh/MocA family oxidoreductase [Phycisphaerae bacterium]